jgi:hypothetical protein
MASQQRVLKVALALAAAVVGLIPAFTVRAGESGPFVQPPYAPVIYVGPGSPLSSANAVQTPPVMVGAGFVVPNATNTGYNNALLPLTPPTGGSSNAAPLSSQFFGTQPAPRPSISPYQPASNVTGSSLRPASSAGVSVSLAAGWDIVAGPAGSVITGAVGPLYTYQGGDSAYEVLPAGSLLQAGQSYWAYFAGPAVNSIPVATGQTVQLQIPPSHFVMIGNPGSGTATVTGVDYMAIYDTTTSQFRASTTLGPGQGAWAWSASGGTATIQGS